jgi:hypothetical protein
MLINLHIDEENEEIVHAIEEQFRAICETYTHIIRKARLYKPRNYNPIMNSFGNDPTSTEILREHKVEIKEKQLMVDLLERLYQYYQTHISNANFILKKKLQKMCKEILKMKVNFEEMKAIIDHHFFNNEIIQQPINQN